MVTEDTAAYLEEFGEPVVLPGGSEVGGVFSDKHEFAQINRDVLSFGIEGVVVQPCVWLLPADAAGLQEGSVLTIRGKEYSVTRPEPDGYGLVKIPLAPVTAPAGSTWK